MSTCAGLAVLLYPSTKHDQQPERRALASRAPDGSQARAVPWFLPHRVEFYRRSKSNQDTSPHRVPLRIFDAPRNRRIVRYARYQELLCVPHLSVVEATRVWAAAAPPVHAAIALWSNVRNLSRRKLHVHRQKSQVLSLRLQSRFLRLALACDQLQERVRFSQGHNRSF